MVFDPSGGGFETHRLRPLSDTFQLFTICLVKKKKEKKERSRVVYACYLYLYLYVDIEIGIIPENFPKKADMVAAMDNG